MASVLLYLGILFAIAVTNLSAQEPQDSDIEDADEEPPYDPGVVLVPGPHRIIAQKKIPLLLNCSLVITDSTIRIQKYVWYKDGKPIDTLRSRTKLFNNGSLQIYPRRKKSEGRRWRNSDGLYECIVNLTTGALIARRVEVVVASLASSYIRTPANQTAYIGGVARFVCEIKAEPRAFYVWHKDHSQVPQDDDRFDILPNGVLNILDVKASDAGMYWCQATPYLYDAIQGKATNIRWRMSPYGELKVLPNTEKRAPKIVAGPKDITVETGKAAYLECLVDGWPRPIITWKKKATKTVKEQTYRPQKLSASLVIVRVNPEYAGTYECIVSGQGEELKASATLNVTTPPEMKETPESSRFPVAKNTKLFCEATGNPPVNVSWYFNGKALNPNVIDYEYSKTSLILYSLRDRNSGYYQCIANNSVGQVIGLAFIDVIIRDGAPAPPENVFAKAVNSTSVLVTWNHEMNKVPSVLHFGIVGKGKTSRALVCTNSLMNANSFKHQCWLSPLQPDTKYYVNVQAFNRVSGSRRSKTFIFTTKKDVSRSTIPVFNVESLQNHHSVNVSWQPLTDVPNQNHIIYYSVHYRKKDGSDEETFKVPATQTSSVIIDLESDTTYEIAVIAALSQSPLLDRSQWLWKSFHTAKANASSVFTVKFVNSSAVLLQWDPPAPSSDEDSISGYSIELQYFGQKQPFREIPVALTDSHVLTKLDEDATYEVTLKAHSSNGVTQVFSESFKILDLQDPLVPDRLWAKDVDARSMLLKWSAVPYQGVTFEVCYRIELETTPETCHSSATNSHNLTDLQPYTRYEIRVRAIHGNTKGDFGKSIIVLTDQAYPSPPINVTVEIRGHGVIGLRWLPPEHANGVITSYIIEYGKEPEDPTGFVKWKKITTSGEVLAAEIDDLEKVKYYFKVTATTEMGLGSESEVKDILPVCPEAGKDCVKHIPIPGGGDNEDIEGGKLKAGIPPMHLAAIIVGVLLAIAFIFLVLFLWCRHKCAKNRENCPDMTPYSICAANGHIPSRPGNGHAHHLTSGTVDMTHPESTTPMLQVPENEGSDSKGGNDSIVTPNGVRLNGLVRPNLWHGGQALHHRYSGDLNHISNAEETQGLIKAMIASTDGRDIISGSGDTSLMMSSLDNIDHTDPSQKAGGDHSSEDSGTGCHRANGRCNGLNSPASSPGGSSEANSSLGRRHLSLEGGHWGDDMGGMVMDPATGTVIGVVFSPAGTQSNEGDVLEEEEEAADWSPEVGQGGTADEHMSNDRDSGHGSEVKTHSICANSSEEEHLPGLGLGTVAPSDSGSGSPPQAADDTCNLSSSSWVQQEATSLPPPPPSPPCSPPSSSQQLSSPTSSRSRNKHSNKVPQADRHRRTNRLQTPISKLPSPPPSPPLSALSTLPAPDSLREVDSNPSDDRLVGREGIESQKAGSGSSTSGQLSQEADVVFSQPPTTSSPPHKV